MKIKIKLYCIALNMQIYVNEKMSEVLVRIVNE